MARPTNAQRQARIEAVNQARMAAQEAAAVATFGGRPIPELQVGPQTIPVGITTDEMVRQIDVQALVDTYHASAAGILEEQARVVGKDVATWRKIVELDPQLAEAVYQQAAEIRAKALEEDHFYFGKEQDIGEIAGIVNGMTTDQQKRFSQMLLPDDRKGTHMVLWDPPMRDGKVYSFSLIPNVLVKKKLERGWGIVPKGPLADRRDKQCDMTDDNGVRCPKMFRTEQQVQRHRVVKHNTAYHDRQALAEQERAAARDAQEVARADRLEQLVEQQARMIEALTARLLPAGS